MSAPLLELGEEDVKIAACEGPLERFGGSLVAGLEGHHVTLQLGQVLEVVWGEQLTLNDREVDLDLVEPTGMNRRMDQNDVGPSCAQAVGGASATMARAVVGNQEHAARRPIRLPIHDLAHEAVERRDAVLALATAEEPSPSYSAHSRDSETSVVQAFDFTA